LLTESCIEDGSRSTEIGYQEQVSNYLKLLLLRAMVVSVEEKSGITRQVDIKKTNKSEPLMKRRKPDDDIEIAGSMNRQDQSLQDHLKCCVSDVRRASGVSLI
jgi:hypothetical protein